MPNNISLKKSTLRYIITKLLKSKGKEKPCKQHKARGGDPCGRKTADFQMEP